LVVGLEEAEAFKMHRGFQATPRQTENRRDPFLGFFWTSSTVYSLQFTGIWSRVVFSIAEVDAFVYPKSRLGDRYGSRVRLSIRGTSLETNRYSLDRHCLSMRCCGITWRRALCRVNWEGDTVCRISKAEMSLSRHGHHPSSALPDKQNQICLTLLDRLYPSSRLTYPGGR
jgi:hypothetical protein